MAGTKAGAIKARATIKEKHGEDFYHKIGKKGGTAPKTRPGGFATMSPERLKEVSAKGGSRSTRKKTVDVIPQPESVQIDEFKYFYSNTAKVRAFLRTFTGRA